MRTGGVFWRWGACPNCGTSSRTRLKPASRYESTEPSLDQCPPTFPCEMTLLCIIDSRLGKVAQIRRCVSGLRTYGGEWHATARHDSASRWRLGLGRSDLADWIRCDCIFCNTLVDRIVPGYPATEIDSIQQRLGYEDSLLVGCEPYHIWVIEGSQELAGELPFDRAGLNVIWTDDVTPYRTRKVRILNGAHTAMVGGRVSRRVRHRAGGHGSPDPFAIRGTDRFR